jgi:hypothetical protein
MKTIRAVGFGQALLADGAEFAAAREPGEFGFDPHECFEQPAANNKVIDNSEVPEFGHLAFKSLLKLDDINFHYPPQHEPISDRGIRECSTRSYGLSPSLRHARAFLAA